MFNIEPTKEAEINKMVTILQQIDLTDIKLLTRDANTLLMRKEREEMDNTSSKTG